MKKLLIASTALSLAGGAAFAEISISGDAELGVDYNSEAGEGMSKHSFVHEVGIDFSASGTTDGGLTFGGSAGFDTNDDMVNLGTVHVSGSFGTLTIGDNDAADLTAGGIAAIGVNDIGVDNMVEDLRGGTAAALRYDNSFGQISIAISAGTATVGGEVITEMVPAVEEVSTPAVTPSEWRITGPDGTIHAYPASYSVGMDGAVMLKEKPMVSAAGGTVNAYEQLFGVVTRTNSSVTVDHDLGEEGAGDTDAIEIIGHYRGEGEDADKVYGPGIDAVDPDDDVVITNKDVIAAFEKYEAGHELGEDRAVGGANVTDGDQDADILKVVHNGRDKVVTVEAEAAIPAVLSPVKSETQYAFGMSFEAGGVTIGVGYDSNKTVSMGAGFSAGEVSTNLLYVKTDDDTTGIGADMTYTMGASAVTLAYGREKPEEGEAMDAVGMGVTHDLGGGATMNAGFGKVGESNKASIGLMFAF